MSSPKAKRPALTAPSSSSQAATLSISPAPDSHDYEEIVAQSLLSDDQGQDHNAQLAAPVPPDPHGGASGGEPADGPNDSSASKFGKNYTDKQRNWIFFAVGHARASLPHPETTSLATVTMDIYEEMLDYLRLYGSQTGFDPDEQMPSRHTVRLMMKQFAENGQVVKRKGGGRTAIDFDEQIRQAIETASSLRQVAREHHIGVSTLSRYCKKEGLGPHKKPKVGRLRAKKSKSASTKPSSD